MARTLPVSLPVSNTGGAEAHIKAGRRVSVTRSGRVVAMIVPVRRSMTDEEEARRMVPIADLLAVQSLGAAADQDEP